MTTRPPQLWKRSLAAILAFLVSLGPLGTPAYAAITDLADEPIAFVPSAPPNIVMSVDDSTSMLADFLPDYVIRAVPNTGAGQPAPHNVLVNGFCRDTAGNMNAACGYGGDTKSPEFIWSDTGIPYNTYADGNPPNGFNYAAPGIGTWNQAWPAPVHSNALNRAYYDPAITYRPPMDSTGTSLPNVSVFTAVLADYFAAEPKPINLTATVRVGMWCNSDWPLDTNWDPGTGGGNHCRINGTDYNQVWHQAPAVADYNYPWARATGANDPKYFSRSGGSKTIYCDTTSAKWPQNCSGWKCNTGTYIAPSAPQTCVGGTPRMGCDPSVPTDYTPAGCNTNPLYGPPGPCTKGAECLACSCNNTRQIGQNGACRDAVTLTGGSGANCGCNNSPIGVPCSLASCPNYNPGGKGTCSDGSSPVPNCVPATGQNCGSFLVDPVTKVATTVTLYDDSQTNGEVCRHNNWLYPGGATLSQFNYPSGKFTTAVNGGAGCPAVPAFVNRPRHYWKTSIEWCVDRIGISPIANDKWRGFGKGADLGGSCQDERDATHRYPRFYKHGVAKTDPEYANNYLYPAFERVDLIAAAAPFVHRVPGKPSITRTYLEEMTNYANWFTYYRTRIQAAKTVISQNFSFLDDQFRVGFHTLNSTATWVNVNAFDAAQKTAWYAKLFGIQIPMGNNTPIMEAMVRIGELFKNGSHPSLPGSTDPIILSCQRNFHMLFTDGIQNQVALPSVTVNNRDDTISIPYDLPLATPPLMNGTAWPNLYREDTALPIANTLADYATYYWATDLRGMIDNVITGKDPAPWQHLNFAALSLGTEGVLSAKSTAATEAQIAAGTAKWPTPTPNTWQPSRGGVDDLWHAAVNARGRFVNAKTSQELGRGILAILRDLASPKGTDADIALSSPNLSPTNNNVYVGSFDGAEGTVTKYTIDPTTIAITGSVWDAATALTTQLTPTVPVPDPWNSNRRVVTVNSSGVPVPFQPAFLGAAQLATLGPDLTTQTNVIEYLRGNRALEGTDDGQLRPRTKLLGDVVGASPILVGPPTWPYLDVNDPGYSAFKATYASRPKRVYAGANDGMMHAFDDVDGSEAWAYIPRDLFRGVPNDKEGLVGLTYQEGGLPFYEHRYFVNATPAVIDVDFGGLNWRTVLVGGLGKGGQMYYALDVTDPASVVDEPAAAGKVLWEFRNADLGYTFGVPAIVKTRADGWVAILPSGYNNASGRGKLFVVRISDGTLLRTLDTGFGTPANPSGLAHISGYTKDARNQLVEQVYGGDLYGNLWRFDLSNSNAALWTVELLAQLTDGGGTPQPITTPPEVEIDPYNGIDRWVFVGTGRLLHVNDLPSTQQQTLYAIRDGTNDTPATIATTITRADLDLVSNATGLGAGVIAAKGWYDDLPPNTRIIRAPEAEIGVVAYNATGLAVDPCEAGQPVTLYARQYSNGQSVLESSPGTIVESIYIAEGGAGITFVKEYNPSCSSDCMPNIKLVVPRTSPTGGGPPGGGPLNAFDIAEPFQISQHRLSWRFLTQ